VPRPSRWAEIVQAAAEEFREQGYQNATLEAIGNRVGLLKGSLYHYIQTKDDLLYAVIEQPAQELLDQLASMRQQDVSASLRLRTLFRAQVRIFAAYYPAAFVYLQHLGRPSERHDFSELERQYVAGVEGLLEEGLERGEFSLGTSPRIAARALIGMLDWMMHWYRPDAELEPDEIADQLFSIALGGLVAGAQVSALIENQQAQVEFTPRRSG
jgi:TetR/AcrR family transcriptional regulator, cholesterol catabolism regulator